VKSVSQKLKVLIAMELEGVIEVRPVDDDDFEYYFNVSSALQP